MNGWGPENGGPGAKVKPEEFSLVDKCARGREKGMRGGGGSGEKRNFK